MAPTENGKTILLAGDDQPVRTFVLAMLQKAGYNVIVAVDGRDGLEKSRQFKDTIHLLLSDVQMPNMTGIELATQVQIERPDIRVLLMSGTPSGPEVMSLDRATGLRSSVCSKANASASKRTRWKPTRPCDRSCAVNTGESYEEFLTNGRRITVVTNVCSSPSSADPMSIREGWQRIPDTASTPGGQMTKYRQPTAWWPGHRYRVKLYLENTDLTAGPVVRGYPLPALLPDRTGWCASCMKREQAGNRLQSVGREHNDHGRRHSDRKARGVSTMRSS